MKKVTRCGVSVLVLTMSLLLLISVGCTKYAKPDDLQKLEEARQAARSAEKARNEATSQEKAKQRELNEWEDSLATVQAEFDLVQKRVEEEKSMQMKEGATDVKK